MVCISFVFWSVALAIFQTTYCRADFKGSPIIIIPGDGGTQIWAKLNKSTSPHYLCYKHTSYFFELWLNLEGLIRPFAIDCFIDNMRLVYNATTRTTSNTPGVTTMVPGFGNTSSVEYLDSSHRWSVSKYFSAIVEAAVSWNYTRGKDIRGAPYDFRKAPNELGEYFKNLTKLIEETYYANGNKKVVLIAHSLGNPTTLFYLNNMDQRWKDKFIKTWVAIAAPWAGAVKTVLLFVSGYNLEQWSIVIPPLRIRVEQRTMMSSAFLLPSARLWKTDVPVVVTDKRNYTSADYEALFHDMGYPTGYLMYQDTQELISKFEPPGVEVHNLYGTKLKTAKTWVYGTKEFPDTQPTAVYGDGDATVNVESATACNAWIGKQKQKVIMKDFPNHEHFDTLKQPDIIAYIKSVVF